MNTEADSGKPSPTRWLILLLKAFLIALLIVTVGTYVFFIPRLLGYTFGHIILMPYPADESYGITGLRGIEREEVYIPTGDGAALHAWWFKNPDARYTVLVSHGNAGHLGGRLFLADALLESGLSGLLYDYRGYGNSRGKPTLQTLVPDADTAFKFLTDNKKIKPENIILLGESIGAGVTSELLKLHPDVAGVILQSPFTSLLRLAREKIPYFYLYPDWMDFDPPFNNLEMVRGKHPPLLISHGDSDSLVPFSESETLFAEATEPKMFIRLPNCGHNDYLRERDSFMHGLKNFLARLDNSQSDIGPNEKRLAASCANLVSYGCSRYRVGASVDYDSGSLCREAQGCCFGNIGGRACDDDSL